MHNSLSFLVYQLCALTKYYSAHNSSIWCKTCYKGSELWTFNHSQWRHVFSNKVCCEFINFPLQWRLFMKIGKLHLGFLTLTACKKYGKVEMGYNLLSYKCNSKLLNYKLQVKFNWITNYFFCNQLQIINYNQL